MGDLIHRFLWCDDAKQNGKALYYDNSYMKYYTIHCMSLLSWNSDVANYTALSIEFIHEDNEYKDTLHMHQNKQHSHSSHCNCKSCFNNFFCVRYILTATPILRVRAFAALAIWFRTACIMISQGDNLNYQVTKAMRKCTPAILLYYTFEVPNYAWEGEMVQKSMFLQHIP